MKKCEQIRASSRAKTPVRLGPSELARPHEASD